MEKRPKTSCGCCRKLILFNSSRVTTMISLSVNSDLFLSSQSCSQTINWESSTRSNSSQILGPSATKHLILFRNFFCSSDFINLIFVLLIMRLQLIFRYKSAGRCCPVLRPLLSDYLLYPQVVQDRCEGLH